MQDSILRALQRTNAYFHGIARRVINDGNPKMGMDLGWLGAWGMGGRLVHNFKVFCSSLMLGYDML